MSIHTHARIKLLLESASLHLPNSVFSHGQSYVAVSRVTSRKGLKILADDDRGVPTNIVYKEISSAL